MKLTFLLLALVLLGGCQNDPGLWVAGTYKGKTILCRRTAFHSWKGRAQFDPVYECIDGDLSKVKP